jgi:hypothetical protein
MQPTQKNTQEVPTSAGLNSGCISQIPGEMLPTAPPPLPPPQHPQRPSHSHLTYVLIYLTVAEYLEDARRQSCVYIVDDLSNGTSQILAHKEDKSSSYCLIF